jgi:hypothetical protein
MRPGKLALVSLGLALSLCSSVKADGFFAPRMEEVGRSGQIVSSPKQEAILIWYGREAKVILRTHFRAGPEELAWVVPVPAMPENIKPGDDLVFDTLERETAPRFYRFVPSEWSGLSCGCWANRGGEEPLPTVVVEQTGTAGIFEYTVLSSRDANELTRWLQGHQYRVPAGAAPVFEWYVKEGWHWLAMRVRPEMATFKDLAPHPISYTYRADKLVYPLAISQLSAEEENEIVLYVLAKWERYACVNWANTDVHTWRDAIRRELGTPSSTNYEALLRAETKRQFGHLFVTEFSGDPRNVPGLHESVIALGIPGPPPKTSDPIDGTFRITRLRAVVLRTALDRDVILAPAEGDTGGVHNEIRIGSAMRTPGPERLAASIAPVALAGFGTILLRRQGWKKWASAPILAIACLAFAML